MKKIYLPKISTIKHVFKSAKTDNILFCTNILKQNFSIQKPNLVWVSDITYIKVSGKFVYLCVIIDLFSRKVISYYVSNKADTELLIKTLISAVKKRKPVYSLIFHSDHGCQYTSKEFREARDSFNIVQSLSKKVIPIIMLLLNYFLSFLNLREYIKKPMFLLTN